MGNNGRLYYIIGATVIGFLMFMVFGVTGESGIVTYYLTVALTFPIGLLVGYVCGALGQFVDPNIVSMIFIPFAAVANYFQWAFFISVYRKWKQRKVNIGN